MKKLSLIFLALFAIIGYDCHAQLQIPVTGTVVDPYTKVGVDGACVWAYDNIYVARDKEKELKEKMKTGAYFEPGAIDIRTDDGNFDVMVHPDGAVIIYHMDFPSADPKLVPVKGRNSIGSIPFDTGAKIEKAVITGERGPEPEFPIPVSDGETVAGGATLPLQEFLHKDPSTSRVVFQSYLLDVASGDTVIFREPVVYDGREYHRTQLRRKAFDPDNDPLYKAAEASGVFLSDSMKFVSYTDKIALPDPKRLYFYNCYMWVEDYNKVYYRVKDTTAFRSDRLAVPMRFLEYELENYSLDPANYRKQPKKESMSTPGSLELEFLEGKAEIDKRDRKSVAQLDSLKKMLLSSITGGSTLTYFGITGVASPEGNYEKNLALAESRMKYVASEALSVLPKYYRDRTNKDMIAKVAGWDEVAAMLERDGYKAEAAEVRGIIARYPESYTRGKAQSMDRQCAGIRALPYYRTLIMPLLKELRVVDFSITVNVVREITPEEILYKYNHEADYREGRVPIPLYEYWHLFNMVKDKDQLAKLYRRALDISLAQPIPWELPANNLANLMLERNTPDSTILAPFIDIRQPSVNFQTWKDGRKDRMWNNEILVANQVKTMLKLNKFQSAGKLSLLLPDSRYHNLRQITRCLAGFWMKKEEEQLRQEIIASSPRNAVVMYMATGRLNQAMAMADSLSEDDAVTHYLRAQILSCMYRQDYSLMRSQQDEDTGINVLELATYHLNKSFRMDPSLVEVALSDFYIPEKLTADARKEDVADPFEAIRKKAEDEASQINDIGMTDEELDRLLGL